MRGDKRMPRIVLAASACMVLAGCSVTKDIPAAESEISKFHQELNAASFDAIYTAAGAEFKASQDQSATNQFLSAVHRKLGAFRSGKSTGWKDNATTTGHFVTIDYSAKYDRGDAEESFVFRMDGEKAILTGYHINSTALIVN
jgi:hypothetical protein